MSDSDNDAGESPKKTEEELSKEVEERCQQAFLAFDKEGNGYIKPEEVKGVLEIMNIKFEEEDDMFRMISDLDPENTGQINYAEFKMRILDGELKKLRGSDSSELLDAFIALGGDADGGGCVDASKLIFTIKEEF